MDQEITVSVVCNAFNHGKYIRQTLDSFVMQKTDFLFEVLIHDDASKDDTAEIIREYAKKHPDIIKPVFQTENQYSQHVPITRKFQYARAKGEFIAWCEGDDYWADPLKLQKQVDALRSHPETDMCAHRTLPLRQGKFGKPYPAITKECVLSTDRVIDGGGAFLSTNSLMFRKSMIDGPYDYTHIYNLDYVLQISGALRGGLVFLPDVMAVYRQFAEGSWTEKLKTDWEKRRRHGERLQAVLQLIDEQTQYVHTETLQRCADRGKLKLLAKQGKVKELMSRENKKARKSQSVVMRCKLLALAMYKAVFK